MARIEWVPGWEQKLDNAVGRFMRELADDVLDDMQRGCPVDTGRLKADLDNEVHGNYARIGAVSVPYAIYVEEGTAPRVITPEEQKALHWADAPHPVNKVMHPGTEASNFMKEALYRRRN